MGEIDAHSIERLLEANAHHAPATRNRLLGALSAVYRRAMELGYVDRNPTTRVRRAREAVTAVPLVRVEMQERLLAALPSEFRLLFTTALDTGARLGELLRLKHQDVDASAGTLLLRTTKAGQPRIVRMSQRLQRLLCAHRPSPDAPAALFHDAIGADGCLRWRWRKAFKRAAAFIGHADLRIHDLRHLAAINLVRAGVDLPTVQAHLGHRHLISTLRYAAYADESASARAARALDRIHLQSPEDGPAHLQNRN